MATSPDYNCFQTLKLDCTEGSLNQELQTFRAVSKYVTLHRQYIMVPNTSRWRLEVRVHYIAAQCRGRVGE